MDRINRYNVATAVLTTCCLCTTLLGSLDNIWYTYEIFLTKKQVTQTTATIDTKEAKQPKTRLLIEAPHERLATIHGLAAIWKGVIRHIYDNAPMFNMKEAEKIARTKAEEEIAKLAKAHTEQQATIEAKEAKIAAPNAEQKQAAVTVQRLTNTILHKLIAKHIGLPPTKGDVLVVEGKEAKQPAKQPDGMAIVRLVHTIFHRQDPTQLTQGDFVITDQLKNCTKNTIAEFVGLLLATIEQGRKGQTDWQKAQFSTRSLNSWINDLDETCLKDESKEKICKGLTTKKERDAAIENAVNYSRLTLQNTVNFAIEACKPEYLAKSPFPPETVYLVLLGLLYQHTDLDITALTTYYHALANRYSKLDDIFKSFKTNVPALKKADLPKTAADITRLKKNIVSAAQQYTTITDDAIAFIHKHYEEFVFLSLLPGFLPPDFHYTDSIMSVFDIKTNAFTRTGPVIADCMDSVMRKICNILAHNSKTRIFSVAMLTSRQWDIEDQTTEDEEKKQTEASTIHPAIKAFYTKHQSPMGIGNLDAHSDWLAVISNIPYVAYVHREKSNDSQDWPGYIHIPATDLKTNEALAKFVIDREYIVVQDTDTVLYEIQPSIRNIIIALDYLLNLNLFNGMLATVFTDPSFVKTYLPKLSKALNLELDIKHSDNIETIDDQDLKGSEHIIVMGLPNKPAQFRITIASDHGSFRSLEDKSHLDLPIFQEALVKPNLLPSSALFFHDSKIPSICSLKDPKSIYLSLFATALDNPDAINNISENACLLVSKDIVNLLFYCIGRHPDATQRVKSQFNLYHNFCRRGDIDTILTEEMYKQILSLIVNSYNCLPEDAYQDLLKKLCNSKTYNNVLITFFEKLFSPKELPETDNINTQFVLDLLKWNTFFVNEKTTKTEIAKIIYNHVVNTVTRDLISKEESNIQHALILLDSLVEHPEYERVSRQIISSFALRLNHRAIPIILEYPNLLSFFIKNYTQLQTEFQNLILALIRALNQNQNQNSFLFCQEKILDATAEAIDTFEPANAKIVIEATLSHVIDKLGVYNDLDKAPLSYLNAIGFLQKLVEHGYLITFLNKLFSPKELPETNNISTKLVLDLFKWNMLLNNKKTAKAEIAKLIYHHVVNTVTRALISKEESNIQHAFILLNSLVAHPEYEKVSRQIISSLALRPNYQDIPIILEYPNLLSFFIKNRTEFSAEFQQLILTLVETKDSSNNPILFDQPKLLDATAPIITTFEPANAKTVITSALAHATSVPYAAYSYWDKIPNSYLSAMQFLHKLVELGYQENYEAAMNFGLTTIAGSHNIFLHKASLDILTALATQKYGSQEEYAGVLRKLTNLNINDTELTDKIVKFRKTLIEQGYNIKKAIKAAIQILNVEFLEKEAIADPEAQAKIFAKRLTLFESLLKNKRGYDDAIKTAQELWLKKAPDYISTPHATQHQLNLMFKRESLALLQLLFTYGYGMEAAQKLALTAIPKADQEIKNEVSYDDGRRTLYEEDLAERKDIKNLAITLLTSLVKQRYGQSENYKSILALLPTLLEHKPSEACINLCTELFRQGVGIDVVLKIAIDRLNNVNQDDHNESFMAMTKTTNELLQLDQSKPNSIAANNIEFKKIMAQYLDLFSLLLQSQKGFTEITTFATTLWQRPPTQKGYGHTAPKFSFTYKREAVELFKLLLAHNRSIKEITSLSENVLKQIQALKDLIETKKSEITNDWLKDSVWEEKEVSELLQNLSITYRWNIKETQLQLDTLEMLANRLLKAAQKAQAVQEEVAKKTRAAQEEAIKAQAAHVAEAQKKSPKHDVDKDEEKPARAQTPDESWVCPNCNLENKPPLPGQKAVCIECKTPKAQ